MAWRALVVHSKEPVALSTKLQLMSEFDDVVVRTVASPVEALAAVEKEPLDLILCEQEAEDPGWRDFPQRVRASRRGASLPMVMLLACSAGSLEEPLAGEGLACLAAPFSPSMLRETVLGVFNPRNRRRYARLSIPGVEALLRLGGQEIEAQVHNLSLRGMLCQFEYPAAAPTLLGPAGVELVFKQRSPQGRARGLEACLLRLAVDCFHDGLMPRIVRAAWQFVAVPAPAERLMAEVLENAERAQEALGLGPEGLAV